MKLRNFRIIISGIILIGFLSGYFFNIEPYTFFTSLIAKVQFYPAFIPVYKKTVIGIVFILLILATIFLGRIYCSLLCPLGTLQDCLISISRKKRRSYIKASLLIRYTIPLLTILCSFFGITLLLELTEPYSIVSRLLSYITSLNITFFDKDSIILVSAIFISFIIVILLSVFRGRLYCNTICPTGAILSLLSYLPVFGIRINSKKCTSCRKCETICKAECIDIQNKKIDSSRCISCFNCIDVCKTKAIYYGLNKKKTCTVNSKELKQKMINSNRRDFIALFGVGIITYPISRLHLASSSKIPVIPPGSLNLKHFTENCTSCHLCITQCPTKVLKPAIFEYGFSNFMKPYLNFKYGACDYNCNICTQICPAKAILPVTLSEKQRISIGLAYINKKLCIPYVNGTACAACDEMCPTGATSMIKLKNGLPAPVINEDLCIGCGACQKACPVTPVKAINVTARKIHKKIEYKPLIKQDTPKQDEDFAF